MFLVLTGIKMLMSDETDEVDPERNPVLRLAKRVFPFTTEYDGQRFFTLQLGRRALTPLALVLIMVETTDLVFALDSIPAIFGVTTDPFIVFTSNVFAILGLRSLYFVLAGAIAYFRFLKFGLAFVLVFIGFKMLIVDWYKMPSGLSLLIVAAIIIGAIVSSLIAARRERAAGHPRAGAVPPQAAEPAAMSLDSASALPVRSHTHQPLSENLQEILQSEPPPGGLTLNILFVWTEGRGVFLFIILKCVCRSWHQCRSLA